MGLIQGTAESASSPPGSGRTGNRGGALDDFVARVGGVRTGPLDVLDAAGAAEGAAVVGDLRKRSAGGLDQVRPDRGPRSQELEDPRSGRMPESSHLLGWHEFS